MRVARLGDTGDPRTQNVVRAVARDVANTFERFTDWGRIDDDTDQPFNPVMRQDLEFAAWGAIYDYAPDDFKYLYGTLKRDLLNEAEKTMRASGWLHQDGEWARKKIQPEEAPWFYGIHPLAREGVDVESELVEKLRLAYPTLAAKAEYGTNERAANALGVCKSTVGRRLAAEMQRLNNDTELLAAIGRDHHWRGKPKRCSGPAYAAGITGRRPPVDAFPLQGLDIATRTFRPSSTSLDDKYPGTTPLGTSVADVIRRTK